MWLTISIKYVQNYKQTYANSFRASYFGQTKQFKKGQILFTYYHTNLLITQVIEMYHEFNKELYLALTDFEKAFGRVDTLIHCI